MKSYTARFHGGILQRGFWIYVWQIIDQKDKKYYYVGRTGDSSSPNAASPFNRLGQHLDVRKNAKGNSMLKNILKADINPVECGFNMYACGPIYTEQKGFENHKPYRDKMAAVECRLYSDMKQEGFCVINEVKSKKNFPYEFKKQYDNMFQQILKVFDYEKRSPCKNKNK